MSNPQREGPNQKQLAKMFLGLWTIMVIGAAVMMSDTFGQIASFVETMFYW